jgi:hypothetical protein
VRSPGPEKQLPSGQLSATSAAEAPYSTASILSDARRALEKLEQLKVRRGAPGQTSIGTTTVVPHATSPVQDGQQQHSTVLGQPAGPPRQPSSLAASSSRSQGPSNGQRTMVLPKPVTSPMTSLQPPAQTMSASPTPSARPSSEAGTAVKSHSHTPAPNGLGSASPHRGGTMPGTMPARDMGKQAAPQRPPHAPMGLAQRVSTKASSPMPSGRGGSPAPTPGLVSVSRTPMGRQSSPSPTNSVPATPDIASRLASMPRGAPKQAVPTTLVAMTGPGASGGLQDYSAMRQPRRSC